MNILGINAYHGDSAACLVVKGKLICAIEEERIRRIKHWAGLPVESIKWCLAYAGISIQDIDYIAVSRSPSANFTRKAAKVIFSSRRNNFFKQRLVNYIKIKDIKKDLVLALGVSSKQVKAKLVNVEHHRAHCASAFLVSPYLKAAVLSVDGFGDFASTMLGKGSSNKIKVLKSVYFPHSLGIFYSAITQFLGFNNYGDEYKVMGLSGLGKPTYVNKLAKIVSVGKHSLFSLDTSYFTHDYPGVAMEWFNTAPRIDRLFSDKLVALLGAPRDENAQLTEREYDIAASLQVVYEEVFFSILSNLHKLCKVDNLTLSGGCAQNSLANGKINTNTPFKNIYIPPAAYDAGGAIGAAFYLWHQVLGKPRTFSMDSANFGPSFKRVEIIQLLQSRGIKFQELGENELLKKTAESIANGKVVGWFQGRAEWGARALGNRSILVDPRNTKTKDMLNLCIKNREWFRPFGASILEEKFGLWFVGQGSSIFMEKTFPAKEGKREIIPAVIHVDGRTRVQTVSLRSNPKYYNLLLNFEDLTGVPLLLNTSFNIHDPIVNTPQEALDCFLSSGIDILVLENFYIEHLISG